MRSRAGLLPTADSIKALLPSTKLRGLWTTHTHFLLATLLNPLLYKLRSNDISSTNSHAR